TAVRPGCAMGIAAAQCWADLRFFLTAQLLALAGLLVRSDEQGEAWLLLWLRVVAGQCLPAPFEVDGLLGDVVGCEGPVVLRGDPVGCALLRNGVERRGFVAHPLFRPEVADAACTVPMQPNVTAWVRLKAPAFLTHRVDDLPGTIPAGAGSTATSAVRRGVLRDHPRGRGEHT
ncbi:hypothetical protein ACYF6T_44610, partial [Streptomyces sp. 7R007]